MLERPDGADLLATAREVVLAEILPLLPEHAKLQARMVAAAIALALRERGADEAAFAGQDLARLAREIRAGAHDPGTASHEATRDLLWRLARLRASVSAPKALG